ncbi:hypothetical protein KOI35_14685 [Actinoplanes bogorensis]|uniref:Uncharacterized protein n=1 Tax=Paractinoplanes bogorensis TaxID=1610840 RepID=A0ABS5YMS8_9ACTN|nr:hypothetical protein [Actinoplanes bogorensis]MBU2664747.1 hypothetical protein [Actinoplanes bogorensis]
MENTGKTRTWIRRLVIGLACTPLAAIGVVHAMGRSGDFGVLGKWWVMVPLAVAGILAWELIEKAVAWATREPGRAEHGA